MSIQERISRIRESSANWRNRVQTHSIDKPIVDDIRKSLADSQETWRKRVEDKDVVNFTVAGRLKQTPADEFEDAQPSMLNLDQAIRCPRRPPAVPILRATSKENRPAPKRPSIVHPSLSPLNEVTKQVVSVPKVHDDALMDFFTSDVVETDELEHVQLPDKPQTREVDLNNTYKLIVDARRAARPERRKPSKTPNPLTCLAQRTDLRSEYEEIRTGSATNMRTPTPNQQLLRQIDPATHLAFEAAQRRSMLADSVIAGLSSTENFSDAKNSLRQVSDTQPLPLAGFQRQLQPYKPLMLLHVKGRRHVQVRLVAPISDSMNSGDCYVLVTRDSVFAWFGALANVVEVNKARELADWIHKHRELSHRSLASPDPPHDAAVPSGYITVYEQLLDDDEDLTTMDVVEAGLTKPKHNLPDPASVRFWQALGYTTPQSVHASGSPEEDELYETLIQHTNRVYEVTPDQLVPCVEYWGSPIKRSLLSTDKAFVFDFGSEVYLWTGTQVNPEIRLAGIELVQQAYAAPYDYTDCRLNPLNPLSTHTDIPLQGPNRPDWTLVGKVTEKGETILFKEKFVDWPDASRIKLQPVPRHLRSTKGKESTVYSVIKPYPADQLYEAAFTEAPPGPRLLTLDGRFVGRGGQGCRYEDGILRRFSVQSGPLRVWHVSEFNRTELCANSHGQFYQGDTYVIRWPFKVIYVGLRDIPSRTNDASREQCVYFFWHGSQSKITEQGASALMTIELDEERCPQIRVTEGKEPPAFCRLFEGRMVVYAGKRSTGSPSSPSVNDVNPPRIRLFLVRGELPEEGYLLEVPAQLSSLRSQGVFLALHYATVHDDDRRLAASPVEQSGPMVQKAWLWCGHAASEMSKTVARHMVDRLRANCPSELALELRHVIEVMQTEEKLGPGELVFLLNAKDSISSSLCLQSTPNHGQLVIWQLTAQLGTSIQIRRLSYTLQPDASMLTNGGNSRPSSRRISGSFDRPNGTGPSPGNDLEPLVIAKAVAERLRASNDAVMAQQKQAIAQSGFPFLLGELYAANQPALFLVLDGRQALYLWQGWWPLKRRSRELTGPLFRSQSTSRSSFSSSGGGGGGGSGYYSSSMGDESPAPVIPDPDQANGDQVDSVEQLSPGTTRSRFYALRLAALQTAKALAAKVGVRASVVYAGLEPSEFLALFPPYVRQSEAAALYQHEEAKSEGQLDSVDDLLRTCSNRSNSYALSELQQRPPPPDLDATCLEVYLNEDEFQKAFSMTKAEFSQLPAWKKAELKKPLGLF